MKLNSEQKKTLSVILADLGKLVFLSYVIGRFVSPQYVHLWLFITGIIVTLIFLISSIFILKE